MAVYALQLAGTKQEAAEYAAELFARLPADSYLRGFVLGALGRFDEAPPFLTRTPVTMGSRLFWDPMWDPFRDDPRFRQVIAKLGRTEEYAVGRAALARLLKEPEAAPGQRTEVGGQRSGPGKAGSK